MLLLVQQDLHLVLDVSQVLQQLLTILWLPPALLLLHCRRPLLLLLLNSQQLEGSLLLLWQLLRVKRRHLDPTEPSQPKTTWYVSSIYLHITSIISWYVDCQKLQTKLLEVLMSLISPFSLFPYIFIYFTSTKNPHSWIKMTVLLHSKHQLISVASSEII